MGCIPSYIETPHFYIDISAQMNQTGSLDGSHASIAHKDGKTAQIFRKDGTLHPGPRSDYTTWSRSVGSSSGITIGAKFIQIGAWRIGDVDGTHASMAHKDGKTAQIFRKDGTLHPGPRPVQLALVDLEEAT